MASKFQIRLQGKILEALERNSLSITDLSQRLGSNYYSTRQAVRDLQESGQVKMVNSISARNTKYTIGSQAGINISTIPTHNGIKINKVIELYGMTADSSAGCDAIINLPRHVTRLMDAAKKLAKGEQAELQINLTREQMERDYSALESTVKLYQAILDNPANWTSEFLGRYPHDPEWDNEALKLAMAHYYGKDSKEDKDS